MMSADLEPVPEPPWWSSRRSEPRSHLTREAIVDAALAVYLLLWGMHLSGFTVLASYPLNFTWFPTILPGALLLDVIIVLAHGRWLLTALAGGFAYGSLFYSANYPLIAPFMQPVVEAGRVLTVANLQGLEYHRSATPEYLRIVETGGMHTFVGQTGITASIFAGTVCVLFYCLGVGFGNLVALWPINRYLRSGTIEAGDGASIS